MDSSKGKGKRSKKRCQSPSSASANAKSSDTDRSSYVSEEICDASSETELEVELLIGPENN